MPEVGQAAVSLSDSVVSETSFDQSVLVGSASAVSRGDHTHGSPSAAGVGAKDFFYYRRVGAAANRWYIPGQALTYGVSSALLIANDIYAGPLIVTRQLTLDRIACRVAAVGSAGSVVRLGIYADNGNNFPGSLVLDAGEVATTSTGIKTVTINQVLAANSLYWVVCFANSVATQPTMYRLDANSVLAILGSRNTLIDFDAGWFSDLAYAALPATYPTATIAPTNSVYVTAVRIASQV